MQNKTHSY